MSRGAQGLCLGLCILLNAVTQSFADHSPAQAVSLATAGWPIGDFSLVDQNGNPFVKQSLDGRWTLLVLGDSQCGDACAAALSATTGLLSRIAGTHAVQTTQVVLLSLRSDNTTAAMRRLLDPYGAGFIGVTGPSQVLAGLVDDLGVIYQPLAGQASPMPGDLGHAGSVWLIGPDAIIRAELLPPFDVLLLTAEYLKTRLRG